MENRSNSRIQSLDFLRGISILLVVLLHFHSFVRLNPAIIPLTLFSRLTKNGYYGVSLFFVISGYLITLVSLKRYGSLSKISLKQFYWFRITRLFPGLLILVGLNLFLFKLGFSDFKIDTKIHSIPKLLFSLFSFHFNVYRSATGPVAIVWDSLWSLSIEEMFYLGFPLICKLLKRERSIVIFLLLVFLSGPAYRHLGGRDESVLFDFWGCFDQLALGCLLALGTRNLQSLKGFASQAKLFLCLGGLMIWGGMVGTDVHTEWVLGPMLISTGAAAFILGCALMDEQVVLLGLLGRALGSLGRLSYEIYLFHIVIFALLIPPLTQGLKSIGLSAVSSYTDIYSVLAIFLVGTLTAVLTRWGLEPLRVKLRSLQIREITTSSAYPKLLPFQKWSKNL